MELINYKAISIKYFECVFLLALAVRQANRICSTQQYIVMCGLSGCTIVFPHYLMNGMIFGKNNEHKMCGLIFSIRSSETFLILRRIHLDVIINVRRSSWKVSVILAIF